MEPFIEIISINQDTVSQGSFDLIQITLGFTDGDKNLIGSDGYALIYIEDARFEPTRIDEGPLRLESFDNSGEKEEAKLSLFPSCCIYPNATVVSCEPMDGFPIDTVILDIYLYDMSGNKSNTV
ncbi:MAG: hypothetical protein ACJATF_004156 [Flavobacteriales bacterium]